MIELPFPPAVLNPNHRPHWAVKARAFKAYKFQCFALLRPHRDKLQGRAAFDIEFRPPDGRRRDCDNLLAAIKAAVDALSQVTGVDDSKFCFTVRMGEPHDYGAVIVS